MMKRAALVVAAVGFVLGLIFAGAVRNPGGSSYRPDPPACFVGRVALPSSVRGTPTEGVLAPDAYAKALDDVLAAARREGTSTAQLTELEIYDGSWLYVTFAALGGTVRYGWSGGRVMGTGVIGPLSDRDGSFAITPFKTMNPGALLAHATELCELTSARLTIKAQPGLPPSIEVKGQVGDDYVTLTYDTSFTTLPTWWLSSSDLARELAPMLDHVQEVTYLSVDDTSLYVRGTTADGDHVFLHRSDNEPTKTMPDTVTNDALKVRPDQIDPDVITWALQRAAIELGEKPLNSRVYLSDENGHLIYRISLGGAAGYATCTVRIDGSELDC